MMAIADQVFGFFTPVVNLKGPGSVKEVGVQAKTHGCKKALIVTDTGMEKMGIADQIKEIIEAEGLKIFQENKCDQMVKSYWLIICFGYFDVSEKELYLVINYNKLWKLIIDKI